jgi:glycosyltransferase involved in cell wall biosynthesis
MRRRQQQVALGLAARGNTVLYLNPPRPFRALIDPERFELQEISLTSASSGAAGEGAAERPGSSLPDVATGGGPIQVAAVRVREITKGLFVGDRGVAVAAMGRWGWTTRTGWSRWAKEVRHVVEGLLAAPADQQPARALKPDLALVYHPALIAPVRAGFAGPIVFDCVDDFPSLASSRSIADAFEDALTQGIPLVDGMLAVNRYLLESWGRLLRPEAAQAVVEHGVDLSLFKPPDPARGVEIRSALEIAPERKMVCYLGRFDSRISYEDIQTMMGLEENAIFLFVGEVSSDGRAILQRLPGPRIMPVGPIRPEQAADVVAASDVLIFPFRREPHLEAVRGLKLYEYLATGQPIVASFRRTLKAFRELVYLYATREELEEAYRMAQAEPAGAPQRKERWEVAQGAAWEKRVGQVEEFLQGVLSGA